MSKNNYASSESTAVFLSKYGFMRQNYLEEHKPDLYAELLRDGELKSHCLEVQEIAENRLKSMMAQIVQIKPPPNRNTDGLAWATHMGMLKRSVEEIIFDELIYE
jgi:hypothetical protein